VRESVERRRWKTGRNKGPISLRHSCGREHLKSSKRVISLAPCPQSIPTDQLSLSLHYASKTLLNFQHDRLYRGSARRCEIPVHFIFNTPLSYDIAFEGSSRFPKIDLDSVHQIVSPTVFQLLPFLTLAAASRTSRAIFLLLRPHHSSSPLYP
jgi:hypothetical protein